MVEVENNVSAIDWEQRDVQMFEHVQCLRWFVMFSLIYGSQEWLSVQSSVLLMQLLMFA